MKKNIFAILFIIAAFLVLLFVNIDKNGKNNEQLQHSVNVDQNRSSQLINTPSETKVFSQPITRAQERVTKKPFGIFITPKNSPVQPERFYGFHTGADFEIFPEEENSEVAINAVCTGKILTKRIASGYGGVVVQGCKLNENSVTIIYGHLNLESIVKNAGDELQIGDQLGFLGKGFSSQTDGERKHLHLGIHKGSNINLLGYVQSEGELVNWFNPCGFVCK